MMDEKENTSLTLPSPQGEGVRVMATRCNRLDLIGFLMKLLSLLLLFCASVTLESLAGTVMVSTSGNPPLLPLTNSIPGSLTVGSNLDAQSYTLNGAAFTPNGGNAASATNTTGTGSAVSSNYTAAVALLNQTNRISGHGTNWVFDVPLTSTLGPTGVLFTNSANGGTWFDIGYQYFGSFTNWWMDAASGQRLEMGADGSMYWLATGLNVGIDFLPTTNGFAPGLWPDNSQWNGNGAGLTNVNASSASRIDFWVTVTGNYTVGAETNSFANTNYLYNFTSISNAVFTFPAAITHSFRVRNATANLMILTAPGSQTIAVQVPPSSVAYQTSVTNKWITKVMEISLLPGNTNFAVVGEQPTAADIQNQAIGIVQTNNTTFTGANTFSAAVTETNLGNTVYSYGILLTPAMFGGVAGGSSDASTAFLLTAAAANATNNGNIDLGGQTFLEKINITINVNHVWIHNGIILWQQTNGACITRSNTNLDGGVGGFFTASDLTIYQNLGIPSATCVGFYLGDGVNGDYGVNNNIERNIVTNVWRDVVLSASTQTRIVQNGFYDTYSNCVEEVAASQNSDMLFILQNDFNQGDGKYPVSPTSNPAIATNMIAVQIEGGNRYIEMSGNNGGFCAGVVYCTSNNPSVIQSFYIHGDEFENLWNTGGADTNIPPLRFWDCNSVKMDGFGQLGNGQFSNSNHNYNVGIYADVNHPHQVQLQKYSFRAVDQLTIDEWDGSTTNSSDINTYTKFPVLQDVNPGGTPITIHTNWADSGALYNFTNALPIGMKGMNIMLDASQLPTASGFLLRLASGTLSFLNNSTIDLSGVANAIFKAGEILTYDITDRGGGSTLNLYGVNCHGIQGYTLNTSTSDFYSSNNADFYLYEPLVPNNGITLSSTNNATVTSTGLTNATSETLLFVVTAGTGLSLKDGSGNTITTPILNEPIPLKPNWRFTGTAVTASPAISISK
jgi:hypothetical protein